MNFKAIKYSLFMIIATTVVSFFLLSGCGANSPSSPSKQESLTSSSTDSTTSKTEDKALSYNEVKEMRVGRFNNPKHLIIKSLPELQALVESRKYESYGPGTTFDLFDKYDEAYFNESSLVVLEFEYGSGSTVTRIDTAHSKNNIIYISGTATNDYPITGDMAYWVFCVEFNMNELKDMNDIVVDMDIETINTSGLK